MGYAREQIGVMWVRLPAFRKGVKSDTLQRLLPTLYESLDRLN